MRRRDLIAGLLLAGTCHRGLAQQARRPYRLAVVSPSTPITDMRETSTRAFFRAMFEKLRQLGYIEGRNLIVERYSGEGRTESFSELARDVVRRKPDVIFVISTRLARAFKEETDQIPIVAATADPVMDGLVASLASPGGNITGVTMDAGIEIAGKRLELLMEVVPHLSKVGFLNSRKVWDGAEGRAMQEAAKMKGVTLVAPPLDGPFGETEYRRAFAAMLEQRVDGIVLSDQPEHVANRQLVAELAAVGRLPAIYAYRDSVQAGGLMAYTTDLSALYVHVAEDLDLILKGAKPGEIPYYQATKFELIINLKAAKSLGLNLPEQFLLRAAEVIE